MDYTRLTRFGLLSVTGEDARDFLHAQLTNDIQNLPPERAALAGWCSAKGRLLASFLVIPAAQGFLLQVARDLTPVVAKRLALFVLRSKVKIADESDKWSQLGVWGEIPGLDAPRAPLGIGRQGSMTAVRMAEGRTLILATEAFAPEGKELDESRWTLEEIRTGRPLITSATQDLFIPQMVNFHTLGGVDFRKGCYPGQEIVARTQYRGQVKRHMVHARVADGTGIGPGAAFGEGGTVVNAAPGDDGITELLAVVPIPQE
jgi:folate-binding protein YgfZ